MITTQFLESFVGLTLSAQQESKIIFVVEIVVVKHANGKTCSCGDASRTVPRNSAEVAQETFSAVNNEGEG